LKKKAAADNSGIMWPIAFPLQKTNPVNQENGLEDDLEPPGIC